MVKGGLKLRVLIVVGGVGLLLGMVWPSFAQNTRRFPPTFADVAYVPDGDYKQKVDVFIPEDADAPLPTILLLHGNGYTKWDMQPLAEYFVGQGYAAVAVEYRNPFPQLAEDAFCALAWTHAEAETYGFDAERVVILGHSMGGFAATIVSLADEPSVYLEDCPHELPSEDYLAGTILYAAGNIDARDERLRDEERISLETIITMQIDGSEAPFLLVHGEDDSRVRSTSSEHFAEDLEAQGVEVTLVLLPKAGHFFNDPLTEAGGQAIEAVQVFLDTLFAADEGEEGEIIGQDTTE